MSGSIGIEDHVPPTYPVGGVQSEMGEEAQHTHLNQYLPAPMLSRSRCPHTLVKHVLDVICPQNLGQNLSRGRELFIGCTNFRFTSTGRVRGDRPIGHHNCQCGGPTSHDPDLRILESLCEFTDIIREHPRRINPLPMKNIFLVACTTGNTQANSHGTIPRSHAN